MTEQAMTADEFDDYFDNGGDTTAFIVPGTIRRPNQERAERRVNFTVPEWLIDEIDERARHLAVSRQAVAVTWLAERAEQERVKRMAM